MTQNILIRKNFWADRRVCVTGGAGFLGSFVQETFRERGATEIFIPHIEDYDLTQRSPISVRCWRMPTRTSSSIWLLLAGGIGANRARPS